MYATQPGLSKQIKRLEDELGFLIFQRRGRSLQALTAGGTQVLGHARRVLDEAGCIHALALNRRPASMGSRLGDSIAPNCNL